MPKDTRDDDIMTLDDVARYLNVQTTLIIRWIKNNYFPFHVFLGNYVFNRSEVQDWISNNNKKVEDVTFTIIQEPRSIQHGRPTLKLSENELHCRLSIKTYKSWGTGYYLVIDVNAGASIAKKLGNYIVAFYKMRHCMALTAYKNGYSFRKYKDRLYHNLNVKIPVGKVPGEVLDVLYNNDNEYQLCPVIDAEGSIILDFENRYITKNEQRNNQTSNSEG